MTDGQAPGNHTTEPTRTSDDQPAEKERSSVEEERSGVDDGRPREGERSSMDEDHLRDEIDEVGRRASRTVELGGRALVVSVAVFVLLVGLILPWMNGSSGLEVLIGQETGKASMVPRLFALTSVLGGHSGQDSG